ncbi:hypothetical protein BBBOND_0201350 [Babesia bigemina]|uniref:Uncharacterized protein n=1 Tax=Babesia bigemina TaxID=5866 RepID=A0A061D2Y5_BABBI|nr:hypothetical protein BBBOND_0201350 [Babesia bigemina]CDR94978.1 hypothetical protein BBBOND_0201350 [Babesia bigemina]|eukprot:XP_012767164.1 hypothetical protein BBBOND_0201350 [Babesia bigemina]
MMHTIYAQTRALIQSLCVVRAYALATSSAAHSGSRGRRALGSVAFSYSNVKNQCNAKKSELSSSKVESHIGVTAQ